ncbi:DUF4331 domain-containing protein [Enterobacteriaceae bacterium H11S18]|uniref:DUF4331 family protein n=1 Tax=Dryocola clanedunensis TaxID=2925396 RepID=UPI0022F00526|nr:DUF4331 family protein [Dryocola clanedunensis]MCT4712786.1 DUF4331 domain-containing protein [Dryocola clanedunensis]
MKIQTPMLKFTLLITSLLWTWGAFASQHFDSAGENTDPRIIQLDNYVFQSSLVDATSFIMDVNPAPKNAPDGVFKPGVLYNIHIANDAEFKTGQTFSLMFNNNGEYTVYRLAAPDAPVGEKGQPIGTGELNKKTALAEGVRVWAGVVKDPFFANSQGVERLQQQLSKGTYDPAIWASAKRKNSFSGRKCAAIVLDVPNKLLGKTVNVFMTTAVPKDSSWEQVQYSALPLLSYFMFDDNKTLKSEHNRSRPGNMQDMSKYVSARVAHTSSVTNSQKDPQAYGDRVASMLVPDVITYYTWTAARFTAGAINGRSLSDDAMSEMLTLLLGEPVDQRVTNKKMYTHYFPYLIPAPFE